MIFHLLLAAVSVGSVALQQANITQGSLGKVMSAYTKENRTLKTTNVTSAVSEVDLTKLEDQIQSNQTSSVVTEDDERFQEQEFVVDLSETGCDRKQLIHATNSICAERFHKDMQDIPADDWCVLEHILRPYNDMTLCMEMVTNLVGCYFPNSDVQELFLILHSNYFHNCSEEQQFADAPQSVVLTLTIAPVSLIPVLVYMVIRRS